MAASTAASIKAVVVVGEVAVAVKPQRKNGSVIKRPIAMPPTHRRSKGSRRSFARIALI